MKTSDREQELIDRRKDSFDEGRDYFPEWTTHSAGRDLINTASLNEKFKIAGRVIGKRELGKIAFIVIEDSTGQIQAMFKESSDSFHEVSGISLGDCISVRGVISKNKREEYIIVADCFEFFAKALREPPDRQHGIINKDQRYRHREIEMAYNKDTRELFEFRSSIIWKIRNFLEGQKFLEVETPVLQPIYGGATARPFITYHNSLAKDFYLRISSELYLKRYLVGGLDKVFHIGKCFRNEGLSPNHNPEFTMVEYFATCKNYIDMARLTVILLYSLGITKMNKAKTVSYSELIRYHSHDIKYITNDEAKQVFTEKIEHKLIEPTFVIDLPSDDWPLSRKLLHNDRFAQSWELYINGLEIASGASDLNNPMEQAQRWEHNTAQDVDDFNEANPYDESYIYSLEHGLLPIAGVGIGIDRLVMLLAEKKSLREVTMFPAMGDK